jgi:O-antigen/teichoic acid export membrane protein
VADGKKPAMSFARQYFWSAATEIARFTIQPMVALVLAAVLDPDDFGLVGICLIVMSLLQVFKDGGLGEAIIQSKEKNVADFAFTVQLLFGFVFVAALFFAAGPIAGFYEKPELLWPIRVLALTFIISPFVVTPIRVAQKELNFRIAFWRQLIAPLLAGIVSISLALMGAKYWALIAGNLVGQVVSAVVFLFIFSWRPRIRFRTNDQNQQMRFGAHMLFQGFLRWISNSAAKLCLGKTKGTTQLGFFEVAQQGANMPYAVVAGALQRLVYPVLSKKTQQGEPISDFFLLVVRRLVLLTVPMGMFGAWSAYPAIQMCLGEKWLPMFGIFLACLLVANLASIVNLNNAVFKAMDRPQIQSKFMAIRIAISTPFMIWASFYGINALALTWAGFAILFSPINSYLVCRTLNLSYSNYLKQIVSAAWLPIATLSVAGLLIYYANLPSVVSIGFNLLAFLVVFFVNLLLNDRELFDYARVSIQKIQSRVAA